MVRDYVTDRRLNVDVDVLSEQVRTGDLSAILHHYEQDLKRPLTSALTGMDALFMSRAFTAAGSDSSAEG